MKRRKPLAQITPMPPRSPGAVPARRIHSTDRHHGSGWTTRAVSSGRNRGALVELLSTEALPQSLDTRDQCERLTALELQPFAASPIQPIMTPYMPSI